MPTDTHVMMTINCLSIEENDFDDNHFIYYVEWLFFLLIEAIL
jgi:hypothetical protein